MEEHQAIWDARYERVRREERTVPGEPWLEAWLDRVPARGTPRALDLGCGSGHNVRRLFPAPWRIHALEEKTTLRFGAPKVLWELATTSR